MVRKVVTYLTYLIEIIKSITRDTTNHHRGKPVKLGMFASTYISNR